jgi:DNA (cytosine-5)-methyltransferase 1
MSLGFHRAGFRSVVAVELDEIARESHRSNFAPRVAPEPYTSFADIRTTHPLRAVKEFTARGIKAEDAVDFVIGGPPCQAFSRLGRARLWELAGKKQAHVEDERATMYHHFLMYVSELDPIGFVMENVREIGLFGGRNVAEEIAATADELGYETRYTLLNAVWFGVPQLRERMVIVGFRKELGLIPTFPEIQHRYDLPVGYSTARAGTGRVDVRPPRDRYVDHHDTVRRPRRAVTAADAFADLPAITEHLDGRKGKGVPRDPNQEMAYGGTQNAFTRAMKRWPEFESPDGSFTGHVIRYTPRDYEIFRRMPHGGQYPEALAVAHQIFEEKLRKYERRMGRRLPPSSSEFQQLFRETVPPYKPDKYPNKFRKMWPDHPARTLPAHLGKDSYSHIHFDSSQARSISLREAARLQSFPDAFRLSGSMNAQLRQIGNAVPPLLAYAVASSIREQLQESLPDTAFRRIQEIRDGGASQSEFDYATR